MTTPTLLELTGRAADHAARPEPVKSRQPILHGFYHLARPAAGCSRWCDLVAELGCRGGQPAPEALRNAAEDGEVVTLRIAGLPELHAHQRDRAGGCAAQREGTRVE